MLFESELGLVVNVYCETEVSHKKFFKRNVIDILREERKQNYKKCSINTTTKKAEGKTKNKFSEYKAETG